MDRRSFLKAAGWATIAGAMECATAASQQRPNIVFLLTDDQSYNSLGCMGNRQVKTPHLRAGRGWGGFRRTLRHDVDLHGQPGDDYDREIRISPRM